MLFVSLMCAILAIVSLNVNVCILGNNLQIQVSRMMEELLDLREYIEDLKKDIANVRRDLSRNNSEKQTIIEETNKTVCHCLNEYVAGRQHELFCPAAEDSKKRDILLRGLAKEKVIRINLGKKLEALEDAYGLNLSELATKIGNVKQHTEDRINAKINAIEVALETKQEAKTSKIELKLNEKMSILNQTINNLYSQVENCRLKQEALPHCEDGWREYQGSCYSFVLRNMSWFDAEQLCQAFNSHLLRIDNHNEFQFIQEVLNQLYQTELKQGIHSVVGFWTAANDIMKEGHWVWSPRNVQARFAVWWNRQPDNFKGNEDCAELSNVRQFKMNDSNCEWKIFFICEISRKMD